jgi:hypothetical protein
VCWFNSVERRIIICRTLIPIILKVKMEMKIDNRLLLMHTCAMFPLRSAWLNSLCIVCHRVKSDGVL